MTLAEIKTQLTELYLADGYTFDETHEMLEEGVITWKGCKGKITHTNGKVDSFKITEVVSWSEANEYKDPFLDATEWLTEDFVCAPEVKANNHKQEPIMRICNMPPAERKVIASKRYAVIEGGLLRSYPNSHFLNPCEDSGINAADQTPESYSHQVFIDYTNENTNRA